MNVETPTCMFGKGQGHFRELPRGELQIDQINGIPFYEATGVIPNWCPLENV